MFAFEALTLIPQRNIPGKIIVVYDEDERIAPHAATTLVQRGYDNLFMLSGGKEYSKPANVRPLYSTVNLINMRPPCCTVKPVIHGHPTVQ